MAEAQSRIVGTEMEWPIAVRMHGDTQRRQLTESIIPDYRRKMIKLRPDGLVMVDGMLSNGARYYPDVGDKDEYATPENTGFASCVESELAGERIVMHGLAALLASEHGGEIDEAYLQKQVADDFGSVWGYHVNLSGSRESFRDVEESTPLLLAHIATSVPLLGGGKLYRKLDAEGKRTVRYSLGQKVLGITCDYGSGTTNGIKPIINKRDEPHADEKLYRRLHITGVDPHISPWATWLTLGTFSLMASAREQGKGGGLSLAPLGGNLDPGVAVARRLAHSSRFKTKVKVLVGEKTQVMWTNELQEKLIAVAETVERTPEEDAVLQEWRRATVDLERDPMSVSDRSDAIARLDLLYGLKQRHGIEGFDDPRLMAADFRYGTLLKIDKTKPELSGTDAAALHRATLAHRLRAGRFQRMPSEAALTRALMEAPDATRARRRGHAISTYADKISSVDWSHYYIKRRDGTQRIPMMNPFDGTLDSIVEE